MAGGEIREVEGLGAALGGSGAWAAGGRGAGDTSAKAVDESRTQLLLAVFVPGLILPGRVSLVSLMQILARCPRLLTCCLPFDTG